MATTAPKAILGYLPNDTPPFGKMVLLGFQHVMTMFPATVLCALLMKFNVSTVLAITGLGTIAALLGSKFSMGKFIPLYYGSSFSYIAAVVGVESRLVGQGMDQSQIIPVIQAGFIATGAINVVVGLLIRIAGGKKAVDIVLPAVVTGSVACTIGIGLGAAALNEASGYVTGNAPNGILSWWAVAMITLVAAICFSVYLQNKGFIGMLPILFAAIVGYLISIPFGLTPAQLFTSPIFVTPQISWPVFNNPASLTVIIGVGIMCIATIPEVHCAPVPDQPVR